MLSVKWYSLNLRQLVVDEETQKATLAQALSRRAMCGTRSSVGTSTIYSREAKDLSGRYGRDSVEVRSAHGSRRPRRSNLERGLLRDFDCGRAWRIRSGGDLSDK